MVISSELDRYALDGTSVLYSAFLPLWSRTLRLGRRPPYLLALYHLINDGLQGQLADIHVSHQSSFKFTVVFGDVNVEALLATANSDGDLLELLLQVDLGGAHEVHPCTHMDYGNGDFTLLDQPLYGLIELIPWPALELDWRLVEELVALALNVFLRGLSVRQGRWGKQSQPAGWNRPGRLE